MDALIFVAVAVAWAAYLIPKAIRHHDEAVRSRSVDRFSRSMRIVARREAVSKRSSTLVVPSQRSGPLADVSVAEVPAAAAAVPAPRPEGLRVRRAAARRATSRRRRVLLVLLVALAAVAGVAAYGLIPWWYVAIPAGLLVAWLVTCRIMVKGERQSWNALAASSPSASTTAEATGDPDALTETIETAGLAAALRDPAMWDPVPVTLPTYVTKPTAERTVRTIDLESSGVWTSGHTAADSALARQADEAARAARKADGDDQRAVGSAG